MGSWYRGTKPPRSLTTGPHCDIFCLDGQGEKSDRAWDGSILVEFSSWGKYEGNSCPVTLSMKRRHDDVSDFASQAWVPPYILHLPVTCHNPHLFTHMAIREVGD